MRQYEKNWVNNLAETKKFHTFNVISFGLFIEEKECDIENKDY